MEFKEALRLVQSKKQKDNYLLVEITYDKKIILPYKDGIALLGALANAEQLNDPYSKPKTISHLERDVFKTTILSAVEYEQLRVAALLNVSLEEVQEHYKEAA